MVSFITQPIFLVILNSVFLKTHGAAFFSNGKFEIYIVTWLLVAIRLQTFKTFVYQFIGYMPVPSIHNEIFVSNVRIWTYLPSIALDTDPCPVNVRKGSSWFPDDQVCMRCDCSLSGMGYSCVRYIFLHIIIFPNSYQLSISVFIYLSLSLSSRSIVIFSLSFPFDCFLHDMFFIWKRCYRNNFLDLTWCFLCFSLY